jgi:hypothetical protein
MLPIEGHLLSEQIMRAAAALPDVSLARWQPLQEPGQPLLPAAPEVLDVVVRPAGEVRGDPGPSVSELRLKIKHHALFLRRKLAAPCERRNSNISFSVLLSDETKEQKFLEQNAHYLLEVWVELVDPSEAAGLPGAMEEALGLNGAPVLLAVLPQHLVLLRLPRSLPHHPVSVTTTTTVRRHPRSRARATGSNRNH